MQNSFGDGEEVLWRSCRQQPISVSHNWFLLQTCLHFRVGKDVCIKQGCFQVSFPASRLSSPQEFPKCVFEHKWSRFNTPREIVHTIHITSPFCTHTEASVLSSHPLSSQPPDQATDLAKFQSSVCVSSSNQQTAAGPKQKIRVLREMKFISTVC